MDILDIDEIEDDFGIFEEKMQDDVTNILKQWKIGNSKKDAVFDSRTFTRPKGSVIRNSIDGPQLKSPQYQENQNGMCMKIGGLVSNMQKNLLNDISPPNSICSSVNFENETMSNSLITSADFSSISFFKTSLMDSNIDFAFKNNLKQYNVEHENKYKYEKNVPNDNYTNDMTIKSSISRDNHYKIEKFDTERNLNLLTDSTKENSPNCHQVDNNGSSFLNNTQIMSNTFKKRNSTIFYNSNLDNTKATELDERSLDINKTFLRKPKIEPQLNKTFDQIGFNIPSNISSQEPNSKNLNETLILKAVERNKTFDGGQLELVDTTNTDSKNMILQLDEKLLNNFENATSTPQKNVENEIDNNIDFSPIIPFNTNYKLQEILHEKHLSSDENLFDISAEIKKNNSIIKNFNNHKNLANNLEKDYLDMDNLSDVSDKIENFKEDAMKKSLETIKKRYSHKFDKTMNITDKLNIQKIVSPFPENGRLLSRRSRLNDNLILNPNIVNENEKRFDQSLEDKSNLGNTLNSFCENKSENLAENKIAHNEQHSEEDILHEKEIQDDEKDINTKKKHETKRLHNEERFKTIKINKPIKEQYKDISDMNETERSSPTTFARIDKNSKISNFEKEPLKFESRFNLNSEQQITNEKSKQISSKNLKYDRISKVEGLGKAMSASNLENAAKTEQSFKFTVPAPVKPIKSPMGIKAKSFHNLATNNFGFGIKKPTLQISSKTDNFSLMERNADAKYINTKYTDISSSKTIPTLRPTNVYKKTGLLRPSSGYFSRGISSEINPLQTTFIKENEKNTKVNTNCSNHNSETIKKSEFNSTPTTKQSKLMKATESKLPSNVKRSGLPRPSVVYYRK